MAVDFVILLAPTANPSSRLQGQLIESKEHTNTEDVREREGRRRGGREGESKGWREGGKRGREEREGGREERGERRGREGG